MLYGIEQSTDMRCKCTVVKKFSSLSALKKWLENSGGYTHSYPDSANNWHHTFRSGYELVGRIDKKHKLFKDNGTLAYPRNEQDNLALILRCLEQKLKENEMNEYTLEQLGKMAVAYAEDGDLPEEFVDPVSAWEYIGNFFETIQEGDDIVEHKVVYNEIIVKDYNSDTYWEVTLSRSNSGYWGDAERYDPEVRQVKPVKKIVVITEWEGV